MKLLGNEHRVWAADGPANDPEFHAIHFKGIHGCVEASPTWICLGQSGLYQPVGKVAIEVEDTYLGHKSGFDSTLRAHSFHKAFRSERAGRRKAVPKQGE
jgi:hypothetical protein